MPTGIGGEVAWYCPSLDSVGNGGTTTLYDLAGSNNATLVAMESGDWVADTTFGGIRCLETTDATEFVDNIPASLFTSRVIMSISLWFKRNTASGTGTRINFGPSSTSTGSMLVQIWNDNKIYVTPTTGSHYGSIAFLSSDTNWHNLIMLYDGGATGNSNRLKMYLDGTVQTVAFVGTIPANLGTTVGNWQLSKGDTAGASRRFDDVRLFHKILTTDEIAKLASKRGYEPSASGRNLLLGVAA